MRSFLFSSLIFVSLISCTNDKQAIEAPAIQEEKEDSVSVEDQIKKNSEGLGCDRENLLGAWVSTDDPKSTILFTADSMISTYQGIDDAESASTYYMFDSIFEGSDEKQCLLYSNSKELGEMQYSVVDLSRSELTLMYMARGNFLNYKKVK